MKSLRINIVWAFFLIAFLSGNASAQTPSQQENYYYNPRTSKKAVNFKPYHDTTSTTSEQVFSVEIDGEYAQDPDTTVGVFDEQYYDYEYTARINRFYRHLSTDYWMWDPYWDFYTGWGPYCGFCTYPSFYGMYGWGWSMYGYSWGWNYGYYNPYYFAGYTYWGNGYYGGQGYDNGLIAPDPFGRRTSRYPALSHADLPTPPNATPHSATGNGRSNTSTTASTSARQRLNTPSALRNERTQQASHRTFTSGRSFTSQGSDNRSQNRYGTTGNTSRTATSGVSSTHRNGSFGTRTTTDSYRTVSGSRSSVGNNSHNSSSSFRSSGNSSSSRSSSSSFRSSGSSSHSSFSSGSSHSSSRSSSSSRR